MARGASMHYVSAATGAAEHRSLPMAKDFVYRGHAQRPRKPKGLDWDALTPSCRQCGQKSSRLNREDTCPTCCAPPVQLEPKQRKTKATRRGKRPTERRTPRPPREPVARGVRPDKIRLDTEAVVAAYQAGRTLLEIAESLGVSAPTVARHLDEVGVVRRKQRMEYTPDLIEQVRALYVDERLNQADVAARLGLTTKVVQTAMKRGDITPRGNAAELSQSGMGRPIKITRDQWPSIVERYQAGETGPTIALSIGVTATSIYHILNASGVVRRQPASARRAS